LWRRSTRTTRRRHATQPHGPIVTFDDVTRRYGSLTALDRLRVRIDQGETVALLGPNGAGETTMIELLLGWARPIRAWSAHRRRWGAYRHRGDRRRVVVFV
jgi:ABC-type branched-subunit amino acid transport system ATPase component